MRIPFSEQTEQDEFVATNHATVFRRSARVTCAECGEWVYPIIRADRTSPAFFPKECVVCGSPVSNQESKP